MSGISSPFGQNEWLVEEMYRKFRDDPSSVDPSWHEFLVDYKPESATGAQVTDGQAAGQPEATAPPSPPPAAKLPAAPAAPTAKSTGPAPAKDDEVQVLRGAAAAVVKNMSASLEVPTATSVRAIPAKLMIDTPTVINNHLKRTRGGKISFTHVLGYAVVQAVKQFPNMNRHFAEVDGKPSAITPAHTNLGLAIDLHGHDGKRTLVVAAIKDSEAMRFAQFVAAYEDVVRRARDGKLTAEDFAGVTLSLTNPGTIGTVHSVPRLMAGQGAIIGVGAMEYPAEFQGASELRIADLGVGKMITLTSTYDHRIIQGAESGDFLRTVHEMLLSDAFWDEIFVELNIPYEPVRWRPDNPDSIVDKNARVVELIAAYRSRGHLMADIDPLRLDKNRFRSHPDLDVLTHGLTLWDLDREFTIETASGTELRKLRDVLSVLRDAYCRHVGVEYTHILEPEQQEWLRERIETRHVKPTVAQQKYILSKLNAAEAFETFLQTKYVGQKRFSLEGAE
ncbi:MAG TPA: 2-oxo acid dehydrogenase subunit E2, partial [Mycobacterium sp.]|nr:2-oxo acid dehydrogenase subunit E2 [Mycobacterium sp.]